jgi:hypothetical protein
VFAGARLELLHPVTGRTSMEYGDQNKAIADARARLAQAAVTPAALLAARDLLRKGRGAGVAGAQRSAAEGVATLEAHVRATQRGVIPDFAPLLHAVESATSCLVIEAPDRTTLVLSDDVDALLLDYDGDGP